MSDINTMPEPSPMDYDNWMPPPPDEPYFMPDDPFPDDLFTGAPPDYDFGTLESVRHWKRRIFARAAADNVTMPPGPDDPPEADREQLAEWLACGAP